MKFKVTIETDWESTCRPMAEREVKADVKKLWGPEQRTEGGPREYTVIVEENNELILSDIFDFLDKDPELGQ